MQEEHYLIQAMKEYFGELSLPEQNLIASSINKMNKDLEEATATFNIGSYDTYEWIEDECIMVFSDDDTPKVVANAHYVGSVVCGEWRWSWDKNEDGVNDNCKALMQGFKTFVQQYDFSYLRQDTFPANEHIGWVMSAIVSLYGKAKLIYKIERCEVTEFYVFSHIKEVEIKKEIMKRYFKKDNSFWIIETDDECLKIHFGKNGTTGKKDINCYHNRTKVLNIANRYIKSKLSKGYIEVDFIEKFQEEKEIYIPDNKEVRNMIEALYEFEEEYGEESFVESFYLVEDSSFFEYWMDVSKATAKELSNSIYIFANADATGAKYGIWLKNEKEMPVIFFSSEGDVKVIAKDLKDFLRILSLGYEYDLDTCEKNFTKDTFEEFLNTYPNFLHFREWLQNKMKINLLELSESGYKEVKEIIQEATVLYEEEITSLLNITVNN